MRSSFRAAPCTAALLTFAALLVLPAIAHAIGEQVTDVKIKGATRTDEDTIRAIAGVSIGDELEMDTLASIRERLGNSGMFADTNVFWEPYQSGARVVITVREKFPWAPVPTFSLSPGNISFGALLVHGNLFGRGKQGVVGGRISTINSGAVLAYRDPAVFGSWLYFQFESFFADRDIPEYSPNLSLRGVKLRETNVRSFGLSTSLGVFWWRRIRTEARFGLQDFSYRGTGYPTPTQFDASPALLAGGYLLGVGEARLQFDFRAREHAIMRGNAFSVELERGSSTFFASDDVDYWKASSRYEHGIRFFRRHNWFIRAGGDVGKDLPLTEEITAGGPTFRGFLAEQFRGDTRFYASTEYHVPIVSIGSLDIRACGFFDANAIWFRDIPADRGPGQSEFGRGDAGRSYLPVNLVGRGFKLTRDMHQSVGAGLRFFLRSVAVPLVGLDYGYGIDDGAWRMALMIGV